MFGFGKGKIEIQLGKFNYAPGETIEGKVIVGLKKAVKAKGVNVRLIGKKKATQHTGNTTTSKVVKIFDFKQPLGGEKEYPPGTHEYPFQIKIPQNVLTQQNTPQDALGGVVKALQLLSGASSRIDWKIIANLDVPLGIDVLKKVRINVA